MSGVKTSCLLAAALAVPASGLAAGQLTVKAVNPLPLARASQTLELTAKQLAPLGESDLAKSQPQPIGSDLTTKFIAVYSSRCVYA